MDSNGEDQLTEEMVDEGDGDDDDKSDGDHSRTVELSKAAKDKFLSDYAEETIGNYI